jgi:O-antigen/teichoic acid export membrane protein
MGIIQRQGLRNSIITYTGIGLGALSLLFVQPHFLTKEEIGLTRILFSFSSLVSIFMMLGTNNLTIKYFPHFKNREKGHHGFLGLMLILPTIGYVFIGLLIFLFKDFIISEYIDQSRLFTDFFYYIFPLSFFLTFINVLTSYSYSLFRTSVPALINDVLVRVVSIILFTIYYVKLVTLQQFIFLFVGIYGTQFIALIIYIFIEDNPSLKIDRQFLILQNPMGMLRYSLVLCIGSFSGLGLKYLDTVMLGVFKSKVSGLNALDMVGIYSIAAFVGAIVEAPLNSLEKIIVPKIAHAWAKDDRADLQHIYYQSSKILFLAGGALFLLVNLNIDSLFQLMPDHYFSLGKSVVFIISLGTLINMATGSNDAMIYTSKIYIYITYLLIGLIIIAFINYSIFIPLFGINGAALATASSAFLFNLGKYLIIWRKFHLQPFGLVTLKIAAIIIITFAVGRLVPNLHMPFLDVAIKSTIIMLCFAGLCFLTKVVAYSSEKGFQI